VSALRPQARRRLAIAVGVAVVLGVAALLAPRFERASSPGAVLPLAQEGVGLRLEYRLNTLKDK